MKKIGIIGGGFTGTMTAVQLIEKSKQPLDISIVNEKESFNRGIAYNPYSDKHLLNVITEKMSAYPDKPDHFLDWVMNREGFKTKDRTLIANSFLPRRLYGDYITEIWKKTMGIASAKGIDVHVIDGTVNCMEIKDRFVKMQVSDDHNIEVDYCILATGNHIPGNPPIRNTSFYSSKKYFRNAWIKESVQGIHQQLPILIIGNGLTMVDTVLGLLEQGFKGDIYSISPNGFNILPHRSIGLKYTKLTEELPENISLSELVSLVKRHIRIVREFGISAEPVIDSLRPHTQRIWQKLSAREKDLFMSRLRHLWGVARHRIPLHTFDKIQQLRIEGKLHIKPGKITDITESEQGVLVEYFDRRSQSESTITVSRVINCTGPETDIMRMDQSFLKSCLQAGILSQDQLRLGIRANANTFRVLYKEGNEHQALFTLGSNLKGELWESTAVNELRSQAEKLADQILSLVHAEPKGSLSVQ